MVMLLLPVIHLDVSSFGRFIVCDLGRHSIAWGLDLEPFSSHVQSRTRIEVYN